MKKRAFVPALALLLVSLVLLSSSSYAWFSMNTQVTANTLNVSVTAPENLLISNAPGGTFDISATALGAAGVLTPCSSISGATDSFWEYSSGAINVATGAPETATFVVLADNDTNGYVDFTFVLKSTEAMTVKLDSITFTAGTTNAGNDLTAALRCAILDGTTSKGVYGTGTYFTDGQARNAADTTAAISPLSAGADIVTLEANTEKTITVRIWVEGEDKACKYTNEDKNVLGTDTYSCAIVLSKKTT